MEAVRVWLRGVRLKLLVLILIPSTLFVLLSLTAIWALRSQFANSQSMAEELFPKNQIIMNIRVHGNAMMRFLWTAEASTDNTTIRKEKIEDVRKRFAILNKLSVGFEAKYLSDDMKEKFPILKKELETLEKPLNETLALLESNSEEGNLKARKIMLEILVPHVQTMIQAAMDSSDIIEAHMAEEVKEAENVANLGERIVIGLSLAGILGIILIGIWMGQTLALSLTRVLQGIEQTEEQVLTVSQQLAAASHQVSSGAVQAASSLEETVASVEELSSMVKNNAESASTASSLSKDSLKSGEHGEKEIRHMIEVMYEISASSKKIEEIISVIDDIAFQTNLLALNASVEAARAGEHGRGFAVVAEAVRSLSQRSAVAAKDISDLIRMSVDKIGDGEKAAKESGEHLQKILLSIRKMTSLTEEIAAASKEQAEGISQISKAMNELDTSVQQNASASEEVAASSEEMTQQAKHLDESVLELSHLIMGNAG